MAYSLRLPHTLDAAARDKAAYLGVSLNALVCVALDAYLRHPAEPAATPQTAAPGTAAGLLPAAQPTAPARPSKAERRELTRLARAARRGG